MKTDNQTSGFSSGMDELRCLLERQIELARQGKIDEVGVLSEQAGPLVEKLAGLGLFELAEFKNQRERIAELYRDLCLILTNQKADAGEQLNRLRKGRKVLEAYRSPDLSG